MTEQLKIKKWLDDFCKHNDKDIQITFDMLEKQLPNEYVDPDMMDNVMEELENKGYIIDILEVGGEPKKRSEYDLSGPPPTRSYLQDIGKKNAYTVEQEQDKFLLYYKVRVKFVEKIIQNYQDSTSLCEWLLEKKLEKVDGYPVAEFTNLQNLFEEIEANPAINWHPRFINDFIHYLPDNVKEKHRKQLKEIAIIKDDITERNLRFVVHIAKIYDATDIPIHDLVQEGTRGLLKAIDRFDHRAGFRFSTFASWWIRKAIRHAINTERSIRLPEKIAANIRKMQQLQEKNYSETGYYLNEEQLAEALKISITEVRDILNAQSTILSLESPVDSSGQNTIGENLIDNGSQAPDDQVFALIEKEEIEKLINQLPDRDKQIISLRFGLEDGNQHSLGDIAELFNISRERIRQIEKRILKTLRTTWETEKKEFLDE
jgi:RNA polymerase sigma factor (sigma-70 family)